MNAIAIDTIRQEELFPELNFYNADFNLKQMTRARAIGFTRPSRINEEGLYEFDIPMWYIYLPSHKKNRVSFTDIRIGLAPNGKWCYSLSYGMPEGERACHGDAFPGIYHKYDHDTMETCFIAAVERFIDIINDLYLKDPHAGNKKYGKTLLSILTLWYRQHKTDGSIPALTKYIDGEDEL